MLLPIQNFIPGMDGKRVPQTWIKEEYRRFSSSLCNTWKVVSDLFSSWEKGDDFLSFSRERLCLNQARLWSPVSSPHGLFRLTDLLVKGSCHTGLEGHLFLSLQSVIRHVEKWARRVHWTRRLTGTRRVLASLRAQLGAFWVFQDDAWLIHFWIFSIDICVKLGGCVGQEDQSNQPPLENIFPFQFHGYF